MCGLIYIYKYIHIFYIVKLKINILFLLSKILKIRMWEECLTLIYLILC